MAERDQYLMAEAGVRLIGALFAMAAMVAGATAAAFVSAQLAGWWIALSVGALGPLWVMLISGARTARPLLPWMFAFVAAGILVGLCAGWVFRRLILSV